MTIRTKDTSLRPWDAADEYLLQQKANDFSEACKVLTINDTYGALGTALGQLSPLSWNDSFCSRKNLRENISVRETFFPACTETTGEEPLETDLVIIKIPKSLALFRYQLDQLCRRVPEGTPVLAGAHARSLPPSFFELFDEKMGNAAYSRIWKRARFYKGETKTQAAPVTSPLEEMSYKDLTLLSLPGVFSHGKLDQGTLFLLENFPRVEAPKKVIDPGSGSGILSLVAARNWPDASIIATDDSFLAVASTKLSAEQNGLSHRIQTLHTDILEGVENNSADLVISNPPFHQQQNVSVETGLRFIRESARVLIPGGQLFLVANKHLGYKQQLEQHFGKTIIIAQNKQFRIYMCRKPKAE